MDSLLHIFIKTGLFTLVLLQPSSLPFSGYIAEYQHLDNIENLATRLSLIIPQKHQTSLSKHGSYDEIGWTFHLA